MVRVSRAEIEQRISGLCWWHCIELGAGVVTPGRRTRSSGIIRQAMDEVDFKGARVLDIGCLDGLWSFEAERRGAAEVVSTDLVSQIGRKAEPTFEVARDILGSRAQYFPHCSVFDVRRRFGVGRFDVVIFTGVYYHLKDPLRALATLRQVLKPGGAIIVEGAALDDETRSYATFHYRSVFQGDESNWWVPTIACLREWVECSFFEIQGEHRSVPPQRRRWLSRAARQLLRFALTARAVERVDPLYNCPDEMLAAYDRNPYSWLSADDGRDGMETGAPGDLAHEGRGPGRADRL